MPGIVPTLPLRQPWLKLPEENAQQYEAFEHYRDLGPARSIEAIIDQLTPARALTEGGQDRRPMLRSLARQRKLDSNTPFAHQVLTWSHRFRWAFRVEQFDRHIAQMASEKIATEHAKMLERHVTISMQLQEKALVRLRDMDPSELTSKEVLAYLKDAVMLERVSRELPRPTTTTRGGEISEVDPRENDRKVLADVFSILVESGALPEGSDFDLAEGIIDAKAHAIYSTQSDDEADGVPFDSSS
jgi:hypothetical protein